MEKHVDLLIVGAGPAGLMAAAWASVYGIKTLLIDQRASRIINGHADGLQSRTLEILHSFGFGDLVYKEANRLQEVCFWNPDQGGIIRRTDRIPDTIPGIGQFQQSVLHQGRIEQHFLDFIQRSPEVTIERPAKPTELRFDESFAGNEEGYPITVNIQSGEVSDGTDSTPSIESIIKCKYMIGCDGAHSWVREQLGIRMEGEQTESVWGVMDIIPITNFPDIRMRCTIHSAKSGTIMVIPRERQLVRLYIQLANLSPGRGERFDKLSGTPELILEAAQKIMEPYSIRYDYCEWWTVYQVGQKVANSFGKYNRIFLAGDSVHTHSPKAGQGMNISMQDAYNLGWKIASVIQKHTHPRILATYESERREIALELIEFDRKFSKMFSGRPAIDIADEEGISMSEFKKTFEKGNLFTSGLSVRYPTSVLVAHQVRPEVNHGPSAVRIGMRFPSCQVLCHSDATPMQLGDALKSDGRWRLLVFAGDISQPKTMAKLHELGDNLLNEGSFLCHLLKESILEPILVYASPRRNVELFSLPTVFYSRERDVYDYYRIFADDESYHHGHGNAYETYGISTEEGLSVLVRPDQYVGWVGKIDELKAIEKYLSAILR